MQAFHITNFAHEVIFAPDALGQLGEAIARIGWQRCLLCTSRSQQEAGHVTTLASLLGDRLVAIYPYVRPHVQEPQVNEVLALARESRVDAVIALGGGSSIGMAKAVSRMLGQESLDASVANQTHLGSLSCPVIAIPTTYAGSEMTPVYGVTSVSEGISRKITVSDPSIAPKLIIYDPLLTLGISPDLTASSGMNALAHCFEALYSITRNPLSTAASLGAIRAMWHALPVCVADSTNREARGEMQVGAYLAGVALANVSMGLHHGICHVLGGTAGVAHGIANSIVLPHALRFNLAATATELAQAAEPMGIRRDGQSDLALSASVVQHISDLVAHLGLPQRLRDVGVSEDELPQLAQLVFESRTVQSNPKPITELAQMVTLLQQAW